MADSDIEDHIDSNPASDSESSPHVALEISENKKEERINTELKLIGNLIQRDASGNKIKNTSRKRNKRKKSVSIAKPLNMLI